MNDATVVEVTTGRWTVRAVRRGDPMWVERTSAFAVLCQPIRYSAHTVEDATGGRIIELSPDEMRYLNGFVTLAEIEDALDALWLLRHPA